jgi:hypothetical protein
MSRSMAGNVLAVSISRFQTLYPVFLVTTLEAPSAPTAPMASETKRDIALAVGAASVLWIVIVAVRGLTPGSPSRRGSATARARDLLADPVPPTHSWGAPEDPGRGPAPAPSGATRS